jgi:hypothetical protein
MSNGFWADDTDEVDETNAMRVLREKAEADSKVIREMAERLAKMEKAENDRAALEKVKAKGLDPKVLDLVPEGKDLDAFLADYGALLATSSGSTTEVEDAEDVEDEGELPADEAATRAAIAGAASGAQPKVGLDAVEAKIESFDNADDLIAFLHSQ